MRDTGIQLIGTVPWGTHFCQFYQDRQDLVDILVPYFKAGLEHNEFCMWITSEPLDAAEARQALSKEVPNLEEYLSAGQIEILNYDEWYKLNGKFDAERVLRGWVEKLEAARRRGFDGLRLTGNTFWLEKADWTGFTEYEAMVDRVIGRYNMLAICTYSLARCGAVEIMDVISNHAFALIKRAGRWHSIESAERKRIQASLRESEERLRKLEAELEGHIARQTEEIRGAYDALKEAHEDLTRRMAERSAELAASEERFRAATLAARIGVWSWVPGTSEVIVSADWRRVFGIDPEKRVTFETWRDALHPEDRDRAVRELNAAAESGRDFHAEYRVVWPDGTVRWVVDRGRATYDEQGRAIRMGGVNVDLTDRKRAEEELRRQREWLRVTLTSIGDAVLATGTDGRITFLNPVAAELTGWPEAEALGRPVADVFRIVNELTHEPAEDIIATVLREGAVINLANHTALVNRDGREIPIEDSASPIRDGDGRVSGVVLVFHDVTEKRRAQQALRESEQRVRLKLDSILSPEGDIGNLELGDILDVPAIQRLMEDFYKVAHMPLAILDLKGKVLVRVGWQKVCADFHRRNPESCRHCVESDTQLSAGIPAGECRLYRCKNNMWDIATPLIVGGEHVGNIFSGQFFFEDEEIDFGLFRSQAERYGFDEAKYIGALEAVPRVSREDVQAGMAFLAKLGQMLSLLSYSNIKLARSLSERDALMASLKQSEERLNRAQEISHVGSWELDLASGRLSWSDEVYRIFGLQPQEFGATYEAFLQAVHPDDRAAVDAAYSGSLREGRPSYDITHRVVRWSTGEVRWVHEKCEHLRDESGRIVRSLGMVQDITERKRADEALQQSYDQRRIALEAAELGAWDYRLDTGEVFWDERCRNMFGVEAGNKIGYDAVTDCIHPDDRACAREAMERAIAGAGGGVYHTEFRVCWPDGSLHWVSLHGRAYFESEGEARRAVRVAGVSTDITERRRTEENLRQAQKMESIGLLAGGIAHDFNNLLVGVIGNASLAEDMIPRDSPAREILRRIVKSGEQAAHLTRQLLAYAGKGQFLLEPVNLSELVRESIPLIQSSISKKIAMQFRLESNLPAVESDPSQMQQVFMNLALNAAEAMGGSAGAISISTGETLVDAAYIRQELAGWPVQPGRHVYLEVRDTGCGMDAALSARIFEPFFTTKFQGRGLGLAAVAGIVRAQRGAIVVTSAPGAGTTFRVLLPAMAAGAAATAAREHERGDLRGKGTVLVVDDEQIVRDLARFSLERQGYDVLLAEDGRSAIEILRAERDRVQLVVLDLSMPGLSGEETLPLLRNVKPDLNVIVSSGYSEAEALRVFGGASVSGFIQKPYTAQALAREVKLVLS
jgi:PAS domain S-box-containing protein